MPPTAATTPCHAARWPCRASSHYCHHARPAHVDPATRSARPAVPETAPRLPSAGIPEDRHLVDDPPEPGMHHRQCNTEAPLALLASGASREALHRTDDLRQLPGLVIDTRPQLCVGDGIGSHLHDTGRVRER